MEDDSIYRFEDVGSYDPPEARRLLPLLEQKGIRFEIETMDGAADSSDGGTFGRMAKIQLFVWGEDVSSFRLIHEELFG